LEPTALELGDHACHVYATPGARVRTLAAFLRTGIDRGELCVVVTRSAAESRAIPAELAAEGFETAALAAAGALVIAEAEVFFGPRFEPDQALAICAEAIAASRAAGFAGLRIAFAAAWAPGAKGPEAWMAFESGIDSLRDRQHLVALCQFDPSCCDPALLGEVASRHRRLVRDGDLQSGQSGALSTDNPPCACAGTGLRPKR
jgi:hypothetical protein